MLINSIKRASLLLAFGASVLAMESQGLQKGQMLNLDANYRSPTGTGRAQIIDFAHFGSYTNANLEVENYNGLLVFNLRDENEDKSFELDLSAFGITDAEYIDLDKFNFQNDDNHIQLHFNQVRAKAEDSSTSLSNGFIDCKRERTYDDITDDLLSACLKKSSIKVENLRLYSGKSEFVSILPTEYGDVDILGSSIKIDYIDIAINGHNFKGKLKGDVSKGVKVKFEGQTHYFIDKKQIRVKLTKAKAGFINVKKTLFKELKKAQSDTLKVREPYIYIQLKDQ